jgi:hypothetical protein
LRKAPPACRRGLITDQNSRSDQLLPREALWKDALLPKPIKPAKHLRQAPAELLPALRIRCGPSVVNGQTARKRASRSSESPARAAPQVRHQGRAPTSLRFPHVAPHRGPPTCRTLALALIAQEVGTGVENGELFTGEVLEACQRPDLFVFLENSRHLLFPYASGSSSSPLLPRNL